MLLDFKRLFASEESPMVRTLECDLSGEDFPDCKVQAPVQVELRLEKEDTMFRFTLSVQAVLQAQCARCLEDVRQEYSFSRCFFVREDEWTREDTELSFISGGKLDVNELVYTELVLEVPLVLLCKETCEGLCPGCGNRKPCACKHETNPVVDDRFSILKQLLSE